MSLLKYTVYINSLLISGHCCKIYHLLSTTVGYADDLASGSINESKLKQVMKIVYQHG